MPPYNPMSSMRLLSLRTFRRCHKDCKYYQLQVLKILAWDTVNHMVYYLGTQDKKPGQVHLYMVKDPLNAVVQR